jgi:hypothetical protein
MTMAQDADPGGGDWIKQQSARKKREGKQATKDKSSPTTKIKNQNTNDKNQKNKEHNINKNQQRNKTTNNKIRLSSQEKRVYARYENDDAIRAISHQLHRYVHMEADIDLIVDLFIQLRKAAQHKIEHPFYLEKWHFRYSPKEKSELRSMGMEDTFEAEQSLGEEDEWDLTDPDTKFRLLAVLKSWFYTDCITKEILARRARVLPLKNAAPEEPQRPQLDPAEVPHHPPREASISRTKQLQQWKEYCAEPETEAAKTRKMTPVEKEIMTAVLNGELELAFPPTFLKRTYTGQQQAVFAMYMAEKLHYTLTAKMAPDQTIPGWLEPHALRNLIKGGNPSPNALLNLITSFKERCIGIEMVEKNRTIRCTFPGKRSAARWVNWNLPFAGKFLTLQDLRHLPDTGNDGVPDLSMEEKYTLHISTTGSTATVEDVFKAAKEGLQLDVQSISRPHKGVHVLHERQWALVLRSTGCPETIKGKTKWDWQGQVMTAHHVEQHSLLPCHKCYAPEHHAAGCTVTEEAIAKTRKKYLLKITNTDAANTKSDIFKEARQISTNDIITLQTFEELWQQPSTPKHTNHVKEAKTQYKEEKLHQSQLKAQMAKSPSPKDSNSPSIEQVASRLREEATAAKERQQAIQQTLLETGSPVHLLPKFAVFQTHGKEMHQSTSPHEARDQIDNEDVTMSTAPDLDTTSPASTSETETRTNTVTTEIKHAIELMAPAEYENGATWVAIDERSETTTPDGIQSIKALLQMTYSTRIQTSGNGHCLFYAIAKALHPADTIDTIETCKLAMLLKQLAASTFHQNPDLEAEVSAIGIFSDADQTDQELTTPTKTIKRYLERLLQIPADQPLPRELWAGIDIIRWISKGLNRPIFIATPETIKNRITFMKIAPGTALATTAQGRTPFASSTASTYNSLNWKTWWAEVKSEVMNNKRRPVIIIHENFNHYSVMRITNFAQQIDRPRLAQSTIDKFLETGPTTVLKRARSSPIIRSAEADGEIRQRTTKLEHREEEEEEMAVISPLMLPQANSNLTYTPNPRPIKRALFDKLPSRYTDTATTFRSAEQSEQHDLDLRQHEEHSGELKIDLDELENKKQQPTARIEQFFSIEQLELEKEQQTLAGTEKMTPTRHHDSDTLSHENKDGKTKTEYTEWDSDVMSSMEILHSSNELWEFTTLYAPHSLPQTAEDREHFKLELRAKRKDWNDAHEEDEALPGLSTSRTMVSYIQKAPQLWTQFVSEFYDPVHIMASLTPAVIKAWGKCIEPAYRWLVLEANRAIYTADPTLLTWVEDITNLSDEAASQLLTTAEEMWTRTLQIENEIPCQNITVALQDSQRNMHRSILLITVAVFPRVLMHDFPTAQDGHFVVRSKRFYSGPILGLRGLERLLSPTHPFMQVIERVANHKDWSALQDHLAAITQKPNPRV